ncbi:MAG: hypothetical protein IKQ97_07230, partial [Eubacterium sp.]|nr:hypothetical protein [Eubacterium sp.]
MRKMIRRTGAGLLSAVLLFGMIPVSVPAVAAGETITIASEEDLIALSENCRLDSWSRGKTVELTEDLDLRGCDYKAIPSFGGVFKGNGHTIRELNIGDGDEKDVVTENGLFLAIQKGGEVRDIKLTIKMDSAESDILGGIAASNSGSIYGCEVEGNIHGNNYIGGIVGKNEHDGTIRKCTSLCTVNGRTYTGGIAGDNAGTITECVNEGRINITDEGGDIDAANLSKIDFSHILSATNTSLATDTGGIAGYSEGEISSCENHADI